MTEQEKIREVMSILGKRTSERKKLSSRRNAKCARIRKKVKTDANPVNLCSIEQHEPKESNISNG